MYEQLKAPNLSIVGQPEQCLVYVREVFGIGAKYPTAASGWQNAAHKHPAEQPPTNVAVPVWFALGKDGHVAVSVPGKGVYSTSAHGDKVFTNISNLLSFIGGTYLGWSEDVDGVSVVKAAPRSYTVVHGDTLSGIGAKVGVNWHTIASLNGLVSPYTIYPGNVLKLS